jgi:hypothetical protein
MFSYLVHLIWLIWIYDALHTQLCFPRTNCSACTPVMINYTYARSSSGHQSIILLIIGLQIKTSLHAYNIHSQHTGVIMHTNRENNAIGVYIRWYIIICIYNAHCTKIIFTQSIHTHIPPRYPFLCMLLPLPLFKTWLDLFPSGKASRHPLICE